MKKLFSILTACAVLGALLAGCGSEAGQTASSGTASGSETKIELSDSGVTVNGQTAGSGTSGVTTDKGIVYYHDGTGDTYGAGGEEDMHTEEEAAGHTVVTITQPGTYRVSGTLSAGQIAVDLGDKAETDPNAVVNLILDGASVTCTVAPAIIVYHAYECGTADEASASAVQDTSAAGFNLKLADGTENNISGSYVAKIYQEGTTETLYKYDAAIESAVSFNISGSTGVLNVTAQNEGIESALHLTMNGGVVNITSGDDAVNANADGVSVFTMNGGTLSCAASQGDEGDGIDSNGWIVMNGGTVSAAANASSQDSGVDSDNGIVLNGGVLSAGGNMYDEISSDSAQQYMVLSFAQKQAAGTTFLLKDTDGNPVLAFRLTSDGTVAVVSAPQLAEGDYTLYTVTSVTGTQTGSVWIDITGTEGETQLGYTSTTAGGMGPGGAMPNGEAPAGEAPDRPAADSTGRPERPAGAGEKGNRPDAVAGATQSESGAASDAGTPPDAVAGATQNESGQAASTTGDGTVQVTFTLSAQSHQFSGVQNAK